MSITKLKSSEPLDKSIVSFDGLNLNYHYYPGKKSPALVFLHGVGGNWTVWKKEAEYFYKHGFPVLALDFRGHGSSDAPTPRDYYQLSNFSKDIHNILEKEKIGSFVLIGHSLGGGVAINYCMNYAEQMPSSLILVESASAYPFDHNRILNRGPFLTHFMRFISDHKLTQEKHFSHFKEIDLSLWDLNSKIHLVSHLFHLTPLRVIIQTLDNLERYVFKNKIRIENTIRKLPIPLLVIGGERDKVVLPEYSIAIKKLNQDAELRILKGVHHMVTVEHPGKVVHEIYNFLKEKDIIKNK